MILNYITSNTTIPKVNMIQILIIKVPFSKNKYDIDIHNKDGEECSISNIFKFFKNTKDLYIDKIWENLNY